MSAPAPFAFTPENEAKAKAHVARYPEGRQASAILPLMTLAQDQHGGWLPKEALDYLADYLAMPRIRVYEVASFYDMFNTKPTGRIQIRVCRTTPCWLCGSDEVLKACEETLGIKVGQLDRGRPLLPARVRVSGRLRQRADPVGRRRLLRGPGRAQDKGHHRGAAAWRAA